MSIGLNKDEIVEILKENKEIQSEATDGLFHKIAEVIEKNNKKIEEEINKPKHATFG
ncbi:hypothetical protein [Sporosarcina sp. A2]|uniref:hypothetical protein n=1 Tax=Sporosarcina sp. A2 TaxID=3393449 RepID=UPI003D7ABF8A